MHYMQTTASSIRLILFNFHGFQVEYEADGFLEKNRDTFSPNLRDVMLASDNIFIKDLFGAEQTETGGISRWDD